MGFVEWEWGRLSRAICICSFIGLDDFLDFYCTLSTTRNFFSSLHPRPHPLSFLCFHSVLFVSPFPVGVMGHTCAEFLVMFYLIRSFIIRSSPLSPCLSLPIKVFPYALYIPLSYLHILNLGAVCAFFYAARACKSFLIINCLTFR